MDNTIPTYQLYLGSEYSSRVSGTDIIPASPNTGAIFNYSLPFLPSGKLFKMRVSSFHIEDPRQKNDTRGIVPFDDPTKATSIAKTKVGMIVLESVSQPVCWKNYGSVNSTVNYADVKRQIVGQFDADSGDNLNSSWTVITSPLATGSVAISLRSASGVDYLVDRTNGGSLAPLDHWTM